MSKPSHEDNMDRYNANRGIITDNNLAVIFILHGPFQYDIGWNKSPVSLIGLLSQRLLDDPEQVRNVRPVGRSRLPSN